MNRHSPQDQRGATLVISLIVLVMMSLMVIAAQNLSTANVKAVSNMQFRNEAIAAANKAIALVLSSPFTTAPTAETVYADIDSDGASDYVVAILRPQCLRAVEVEPAKPSTIGLKMVGGSFITTWDLKATVAGNENAGGAAVEVHSGVRVLLTKDQKVAVCSGT
jgi:Tfp pilus assembly protein PilX